MTRPPEHQGDRGVTVVVIVTARPGEAEALQNALENLSRVTKSQTACVSYALHRSRTDPVTFITVERWTGEPSFQAYLDSADVTAAGRDMAGLLACLPVMHMLDVLPGPLSDAASPVHTVPLSRTAVATTSSPFDARSVTSSSVTQNVDRRIPAHQVDTKLAELQPETSAAFSNLRAVAWASTDPRVLELCRIRLSQLLGDEDAATLRTPAAVAAGLDESQLAELDNWHQSARFNDVERAHLTFTEQFNMAVSSMPEDDVASLLRLESDDEVGRFVMALYIVEMEMRMRMVARRVMRMESSK